MTTSKTIQLLRTGLTPIDVEPVWNSKDELILFDVFIDGIWQGSKSRLKDCEPQVPVEIKEDTGERTWPKLVSIVLINEILPHVKKHKLTLNDFPTGFCSLLTALEFEGKIDRKKHRKFIDDHCEWVKAGRPRDIEEDKALLEYIDASLRR